MPRIAQKVPVLALRSVTGLYPSRPSSHHHGWGWTPTPADLVTLASGISSATVGLTVPRSTDGYLKIHSLVEQEAQWLDSRVFNLGLVAGGCADPRRLGLVQTKNGIWLRALDLMSAS
jgi:hypothetical protein